MSVVASNLTSGSDSVDRQSYSTASITPSANKLILLSIAARHASLDPVDPVVTGCGLTWVKVNSVNWDNSGSQKRTHLYRAMGASPSTGAITMDFSAQTAQNDVLWSVDEFDGVDTSGTNGSGAVVQSVTNFNNNSPSNGLTITLAAFGSTNNATFGVFGTDTNTGHAVGAGFSSLAYAQTSAGGLGIESEFKNTNDTSVDYAVTNSLIGGVAIEIKAAAVTTVKTLAAMGVG